MKGSVYTVVARLERKLYSDEPESLGRVLQLLISRNDAEDVRWIEIEDLATFENCIVGEPVIFDGQTLWQEGLYPNFPTLAIAV